MMLYTEEAVRSNIRNREGKRVFYLGKGDTLTPGARDYLSRERIEVLPAEQAKPEEYRLANGAVLREKPEHMTHLKGNLLVSKTHPRIALRGRMDSLEAELLLCQLNCEKWRAELGEILALARNLIRWEVLDEPAPEGKLCGLTAEELRSHSHRPQDYYGQPHFMPEAADGAVILRLNRCRTAARAAELAAAAAFTDENGNCTREDILRSLNRMSSVLYILMIREKAGR
ncbi:MAG: ATP-binding protein [Ruminococcaceae bacterium]|nr:ATP-binding protein [Oscillospiraceae bacterium]